MVAVINTNQSKPWYKSKTIWGLILIAVGQILSEKGVEFSEYLVFAGLILAAVGRVLANGQISIK